MPLASCLAVWKSVSLFNWLKIRYENVLAGVRAIHTQDGRDIITGVESSWLQLEQSTRGEDEALIAEIVKQKMEKSKSISVGLI